MLNIYKIELKNDEYDLEIGALDNNLKFKNEVNANFKLLDVPYEKNEIHHHLRVLIINHILNKVYQYLPELCENLKLDVNLFIGKSIANPVIFCGIENELSNPFNLKQKIDEEIKNKIIKSNDFILK